MTRGLDAKECAILVVDDDVELAQTLQDFLQQEGYRVDVALSGEEALALLKAQRVDLVLSDINMPKMDGLQLLAAIKGEPAWRELPVVMITTEGGPLVWGEWSPFGICPRPDEAQSARIMPALMDL